MEEVSLYYSSLVVMWFQADGVQESRVVYNIQYGNFRRMSFSY